MEKQLGENDMPIVVRIHDDRCTSASAPLEKRQPKPLRYALKECGVIDENIISELPATWITENLP